MMKAIPEQKLNAAVDEDGLADAPYALLCLAAVISSREPHSCPMQVIDTPASCSLCTSCVR